MGKGLLVGSAPTKDDPEGSSGLIGGQGKMSGKNVFSQAKDWLTEEQKAATGGLIVPRGAYEDGGDTTPGVPDEEDTKMSAGPVNPAGVPSSGFAEGVLESGKRSNELAVAKGGPGGGSKGGLGSDLKDAASLIGAGKTLWSAGTAVAEAAPAFFAMFSDRRLKDNIRPVGETYDGQNIYAYDMGDGRTQIGLMAQEVLNRKPEAVGRNKDGYLMLDYDRATEDANPFAYGGLVPREHHADGEEVGTEAAPVSLFERPVQRPAVAEEAKPTGLAVREEAPAQRGATPKEYFTYLVEQKGYKPNVAGAIVGNIMQESQGNPTIPGDKGESFGLFQFHNRGEMPAFRKWAEENKRDIRDPYAQIDFVDARLKGPYARTFQAMQETEDPGEAARHFMSGYERPHPDYANLDARIRYTRQALGLDPGELKTGAARRPGYGLALPEKYSGTPARQASLGDVAGEMLPKGIPTESSFWVPALGFLGSMLASQRTTLGGALGEGLVGGVSAYQAEKKQQMEMARDLRTMFDQRFIAGDIPNDPKLYGANAGKRGFLDKNTQRWFTPEEVMNGKSEMAKELGIPPSYLGVPRAPTRPLTPVEAQTQQQEVSPAAGTTTPATTTQAQPSTTTTAAPTGTETGKQPDVIAQFKTPQSVYEMEPAQLIQKIKEGGDAAYKAAGLEGAYDPRQDEIRLESLKKSLTNIPVGTPEHDKGLQEIRAINQEIDRKYQSGIARQVEINKKLAEGAAMRHEEALKEAQKRQASAPQAVSALKSLANIGRDYEFGRLSEVKAAIASTFKSVGWSGLLPKDWDAMPNDAAVKLAFKQAFEQVANSQLTRAPAATLNEANRIVAQPTIDPGAAYQIIGQTLGEIEYMLDRDAAYEKSGTIKPTPFYRDFDKQAPYEQYVASAFSTITPFRGMSDEQIDTVSRNYKFVPAGRDPFSLGKVESSPNKAYNRVVITGPDGKPQYRYYKKDRD